MVGRAAGRQKAQAAVHVRVAAVDLPEQLFLFFQANLALQRPVEGEFIRRMACGIKTLKATCSFNLN